MLQGCPFSSSSPYFSSLLTVFLFFHLFSSLLFSHALLSSSFLCVYYGSVSPLVSYILSVWLPLSYVDTSSTICQSKATQLPRISHPNSPLHRSPRGRS